MYSESPKSSNIHDSNVFEPPPFDPADHDKEFSPDERNAMRSYLQRAEVRLSTLHRVAVTFISGAGLLLLFPTFFKEEITELIRIFLDHSVVIYTRFGSDQVPLLTLLYVMIAFPFVLSLSIPIYALYLLLKDIVHFYFTIYTPGFTTKVFTPSFALFGITFSPDESPRVKQQVFEYQYRASSVDFAIPFSAEKREKYFDETIENTGGAIIPPSRLPEVLEQYGVKPDLKEDDHQRRIAHLNTALGLARTTDRRLVEEVATQEISTARHVLYLRRLVLRYMKTLLIFIWTTVISFVMLPFLRHDRIPTFLVFAVGYTVWSMAAIQVIQMPIGWIYRHKKGEWDKTHVDKQLMLLESRVRPLVYAAIVCSLVAVILSSVIYFA